MGANLQLRKRADRTAEPDNDGRFPLAGVELVGEAPAEHAFRYAWLFDAVREGWAEVSPDTVVLHLTGGDVTYRIVDNWPNGAGVNVELDTPAKSGRGKRG